MALVALTALGASLIRGWPPAASAAGQAQSPESATLFFVSGPQSNIQCILADVPGLLRDQSASATAEGIQIGAAMCEIFDLHASPNGRWIAVGVGCEASSHTLLLEVSTGQTRPAEPEPWSESES